MYLFSSAELKELAKLPVLFQHFFEHKSIDQNITFLGYLEHHYSDIPHTDNDEDRDNQLPFKMNDFWTGNIFSAALPPSFYLAFKKVPQLIIGQKIKVNNDHVPFSAYAKTIWQPPKSRILS